MDKGEVSRKILSDITVYSKYAKFIPELHRRETWGEIVTRNMEMHIRKFPSMENEIVDAYKMVYDKKVVPSMRALEDSTPVITKHGWKLAKDVQTGDVLYSSNGTETRVLGVTHFHDKDLYKIGFSDHSQLVACDEHLWIVKTNDDLKYEKGSRVVDTKFIRGHLRQSHKRNIHVRNPKPIQRADAELRVDPYILGLWLGDGYSSGTQYSAGPVDAEFMAQQYASAGFKVRPAGSKNKYAFNVTGLKPMLTTYSLIKNKHIPRVYMHGSVNQRVNLVQGLMDTDGCCFGGRCLFSNTNMALIAGMKELLSSLGIKYTESVRSANNRQKEISTISFFTELPVFRLPRKLEILSKRVKANDRTGYRTIVAVEHIGTGNATCFHVDSSDNSFLAGDRMIVTHNSMQFGGKPMEIAPSRGYNCSFLAVDDMHAFSEAMFLLLGGSGVGFSVQKHHVECLPEIHKPTKKRRFLIGDSIEGWADAVKSLIRAYTEGRSMPDFDFRDIRPKGARLITSGGKAPGPEPLKDCLHNLQKILDRKSDGSKLTPLECHDMMCYIADAVLAGGIRRAAMISLFSLDDDEMFTCKYNHWYELNPQRARANNSAVILRHRMKEREFKQLWKKIQMSNTGEPGIFWTNDKNMGINPCSEISLKSNQLCVAGNTKLVTRDGVTSISDAVGREVDIWNGQRWAKTVPFKAGCGVELYRVTLSDGSYLDATADHRWLVKNRFQKKYVELTTIQLVARMQKDRYAISTPRTTVLCDTGSDEPLAYDYGYVTGDGSVGSEESCLTNGYDRVPFAGVYNDTNIDFACGHKGGELINVLGTKYVNHYFDGLDKGLCRQLKWSDGLPQFLFGWSEKSILSFMAGWVDADGSMANKGCRLYGKEGQIRDAQLLLTKCGVISSVNLCAKAGQVLEIAGHIVTRKHDLWYLQIPNAHKIPSQRLDLSKGTDAKFKGKNQVVRSVVKLDGVHDSFCLEEPELHQCLFSNVLTKQCNLTEVNVLDIDTQEDLNARCKAATFIGTLQASYTDFHYLREIWQRNCEKDALLGVSMTGICSGGVLELNIEEAANVCVEENRRVAELIGINPAARVTCIKPSGTTSLVFGCSSGIHEWHDRFYIRRMRVGKNEAIYKYLIENCPEILEDDLLKSGTQAVISIPQKAPEKALVLRDSTPIKLLERVKRFADEWITPGHNSGDNKHNVSVTVNIGDGQWDEVRDWLWKNRDSYTGITCLPLDDHTYVQMPFQSCTEEVYEKMLKKVKNIDLSKVIEMEDCTQHTEQAACSGGACEIKHL